MKLVRRVRRETGRTGPSRIGGSRKPLLAGHDVLLRELVAAGGHIAPTVIRVRVGEHGIEAERLSTTWSTLRRSTLSRMKTA